MNRRCASHTPVHTDSESLNQVCVSAERGVLDLFTQQQSVTAALSAAVVLGVKQFPYYQYVIVMCLSHTFSCSAKRNEPYLLR